MRRPPKSFRNRSIAALVLLLCLALAGCANSGWKRVTPHYDSGHPPLRYDFSEVAGAEQWKALGITNGLELWGMFGTKDGSQLWTVGSNGTILHYANERWERQTSGTMNTLNSIAGASDGSQLWAVGHAGTIVHYSTEFGRWEPQTSPTTDELASVFATADGSQAWAVGDQGTILHYTGERWNPQSSGTTNHLRSISGTSEGSQLWTCGNRGTLLHYSGGQWEQQSISGPPYDITSVFSRNDGLQVWIAITNVVVSYSMSTRRWETAETSRSNGGELRFIAGTNDGSQLWAGGVAPAIQHYAGGHWHAQLRTQQFGGFGSVFVTREDSRVWALSGPFRLAGAAENGFETTVLRADGTPAPYISEVRLLPEVPGAELQVRIVQPSDASSKAPVKLTLFGWNQHNFEKDEKKSNPEQVSSAAQAPATAGEPWTFSFNPPKDIGVESGAQAHLRIDLHQGSYTASYDVAVTYDPWRYFIDHWVAFLAFGFIAALLGTLTLLLFINPLGILYLYRKLKIYSLVEQIRPPVGAPLKLFLKLTVLPWFVTHPRTLRAWVAANRTRAKAAWDTSLAIPASSHELETADIPYVALPVEVKDVSSRVLNDPKAEDLEALFHGRRSVVQIVGPGGGGKTTLARHIGELARAAGEVGAFKTCRLPIWIDEDFTDLRAVLKRKISAWYESEEELEELVLNALFEQGLLLVMMDRVSERRTETRDYLRKIHGTVRCNALLITTRQPLAFEVPEQRFIYPQALDSGTLLRFMLQIIQHLSGDSDKAEARPFSTIDSQTDLAHRLANLIKIEIPTTAGRKEIPMLPLPVVLFVSDAMALVREGRNLEELPGTLPGVYANYLRRINPKVAGTENAMSDGDMLRAAKVLARLALGADCVPKEFREERGRATLRAELPDLPASVDALRRLVANGVLISKDVQASTFLRFALDPVAEYLAAEAKYDDCDGKPECLDKLIEESRNAQGFQNALLLTIQARQTGAGSAASAH